MDYLQQLQQLYQGQVQKTPEQIALEQKKALYEEYLRTPRGLAKNKEFEDDFLSWHAEKLGIPRQDNAELLKKIEMLEQKIEGLVYSNLKKP